MKTPEENRETIFLWPGRTAPYAEYSPDQRPPSLAAYPADGSRGSVIVVPGGGYTHKAEHEGAPIARMLNEAGITAFVLDYRIAPCHRMAPLSDAKRAIRLVRQMGYGKTGIMGFSAGGHVCCCAAVMYDGGDPENPDPAERLSSRPDVFIPCYPVVTMGRYSHPGSRKNLLGAAENDPETVDRFSAELHVTPDTPPAFIWHTAADGSVPAMNSLLLAEALSRSGVPYEMHIFPDGRHGLGLAADFPPVSVWPELLRGWLAKAGF